MANDNVVIDHNFLENIDTERKAYLLGWIAGCGIIVSDEIQIESSETNLDIIENLRNMISPLIPMSKYGNFVSFTILSPKMADDVVRHLQSPVTFPASIEDELKWAFVRGYFDCAGCITIKHGYPSCMIGSSHLQMLEDIHDFCGGKAEIHDELCEWKGVNALEFLYSMYNNAEIFLHRKRDTFISLAKPHAPSLNRLPLFKWARTIPNAPKPTKNRFSDSGYDLHLVKKIKVQASVHYFDTGIQVQPENGYYFDLVGRSSISKTGWMIANNIGIIDASYTGTVIVALVKIDPDALEIELPCKLVQLIPRQLILMEPIEVDSLNDTERGDKGFGSSGK
jgi:deoxyuridine 5'-triphosphate nucleotidohydrolase